MFVEFVCDECGKEFEVDGWTRCDDVTCPFCHTVFETDCDETIDGIMGPWLLAPRQSVGDLGKAAHQGVNQ